jgi:L-ascorbate metabolism protein UlaG (beta-lactamase superfamily)
MNTSEPDRRVTITWLGHATVAIDLVGATGHPVRLLTDPVLGHSAGALARFTTRPRVRDWAGADAVLLSHLHHDHADLPSLRRLRGIPVVSSPRHTSWLTRHGLTPTEIDDHADGEDGERWLPVADGVEVRLVRADHSSRSMLHRPNDAHGFLIRTPDLAIWFAGDTSLHEEMARLPDLAGRPLDVAVVPIGGWGPRLSPGHLGPDEAAEAVARSDAAHAVPVHYGTLHPRGWPASKLAWLHAPLPRFAQALPRWTTARLHAPSAGDSVTIVA